MASSFFSTAGPLGFDWSVWFVPQPGTRAMLMPDSARGPSGTRATPLRPVDRSAGVSILLWVAFLGSKIIFGQYCHLSATPEAGYPAGLVFQSYMTWCTSQQVQYKTARYVLVVSGFFFTCLAHRWTTVSSRTAPRELVGPHNLSASLAPARSALGLCPDAGPCSLSSTIAASAQPAIRPVLPLPPNCIPRAPPLTKDQPAIVRLRVATPRSLGIGLACVRGAPSPCRCAFVSQSN